MIGIQTAFEEFHAIDDREKEGRGPADQDDTARALDRTEDAQPRGQDEIAIAYRDIGRCREIERCSKSVKAPSSW